MPDELVTVFETDDQVEVVLYRALLEGAEMRVLEQQLRDPGMLHTAADMAHPRFRLQVFARDVERARELIAEYRLLTHVNERSITDVEKESRAESQRALTRLRWIIVILIIVFVVALLTLTRLGGWLRPWFGL